MEILRNLSQQIRCRLQDINHERSLILIEVHGAPPRMKFFFQIHKDYTISCFKRFTQIKYNDLVNLLLYRVEQYSQVNDISKDLKLLIHNITDEFKNTAGNLERFQI